MSKSYAVFVLIIGIILADTTYAGVLTLNNNKIQNFQQLQMKYSPGARFKNPAGLKAFIYVFNDNRALPNAIEVPLTYNAKEKVCTGSYLVPGEAVFGMIKIYASDGFSEIFDNNKSDYWDFIVVDSAGKAVRGANLKAGVSYMGSLPEHCRRRADFRKAIEYLEAEIKLYPDNIQAQIGLASLKFDLRKSTREEFETELKKFAAMKYNDNNEPEVRALCRALRAINQSDKADKIENDFANKHNESEVAEEKLLELLNQAKSLEEFTKISLQFFEHYPNSSSRDRIFAAFVNAYLQIDDLDGLYKQLNLIDNLPPFVHSMIASSIYKTAELMPGFKKSERLDSAMKIFAFMEKEYTKDNNFGGWRKPYYYTPSEWLLDREVTFGSLLETAGNLALEKENSEILAVDYFERAFQLMRARAGEPLYQSLIKTYETVKNFGKSMEYANLAVENSIAGADLLLLHKGAFALAHPERTDYPVYLDSLQKIAKNKRIETLKYQKLGLPPITFVARTLEGKIIDSYDNSGKNFILLFFSSWCEPCKSIFPAFEQLYNKYKDSTDIVIAAVDLWEKDKDGENEVLDMMVEGGYNFEVYFDDTGVVSSRFGITGLPTIVYLDTASALQFKDEGFINAETFLTGAEDRLILLKEK